MDGVWQGLPAPAPRVDQLAAVNVSIASRCLKNSQPSQGEMHEGSRLRTDRSTGSGTGPERGPAASPDGGCRSGPGRRRCHRRRRAPCRRGEARHRTRSSSAAGGRGGSCRCEAGRGKAGRSQALGCRGGTGREAQGSRGEGKSRGGEASGAVGHARGDLRRHRRCQRVRSDEPDHRRQPGEAEEFL